MVKHSRSINDGKAWRCRCGNVNQPTKHRFFKLPAFNCDKCQRQLKLNFKFCLGEIKVNGESIIGEVWDQDREPHCVAFAYAKLAEMMERTYNIRRGLDPEKVKPIDPHDLQQRYDEKFFDIHSVDSRTRKVGLHKAVHMGLILRSEGIQRSESDDTYIAPDVSTIPCDDFELICKTLAEGTPLLATYWAGKRRGRVGYCKMYKSPPEFRYNEKGADHIGHAVVLIGAGMKNGRRFFYFLNSWGKKFCPRKNKRGETVTGGIGKIQAEDLSKNVIMLSHPNESGGVRRLQDEIGMEVSNCNYILMKAKSKQCTAEMIQKARERRPSTSSLFSLNDDDDDVFSDDEGGYSHTSTIHQGCGASFGSLFRIQGKWWYQGIGRAIRSLNSKPSAIQMPTGHTTNGSLLMNQVLVANERHQVSQTPVATWVNQTPVANGRHLVSQTPAENGKIPMNQTSEANGNYLMSQVPAANRKPVMSQVPAPNGGPVMNQRPAANGRPQMNQIHIASGQPHMSKIQGPEVHPAPMACPAKLADPELEVEEKKMKASSQKLAGSRSRVALKQEQVPTTMVTRTVMTKEPRDGLLHGGTTLLKEWWLRSTLRATGI